jgi:hypothetical protein
MLNPNGAGSTSVNMELPEPGHAGGLFFRLLRAWPDTSRLGGGTR